MSKTWVAVDDEGEFNVDDLMTQKWLEGQIAGAWDLISVMKLRAGDLFVAGRDDLARFVRELALEYENKKIPDLENRARKHEIDHPFREKK